MVAYEERRRLAQEINKTSIKISNHSQKLSMDMPKQRPSEPPMLPMRSNLKK
jgi:hypothetical protein